MNNRGEVYNTRNHWPVLKRPSVAGFDAPRDSWNYRHLVNIRKREAFHHISALNGYYRPLHIITPPEVSDESQ